MECWRDRHAMDSDPPALHGDRMNACIAKPIELEETVAALLATPVATEEA